MTDLKAAAEAAKIQQHLGHHAEKLRDAAIDAFRSAATPDAILALYAERDEAREALRVEGEAHNLTLDERDKAQASLASYKEEVERLRGALGTIADIHIPDQPAHFGGDELEWAQRHVGTLRRLAIETISKEPPHAE